MHCWLRFSARGEVDVGDDVVNVVVGDAVGDVNGVVTEFGKKGFISDICQIR